MLIKKANFINLKFFINKKLIIKIAYTYLLFAKTNEKIGYILVFLYFNKKTSDLTNIFTIT